MSAKPVRRREFLRLMGVVSAGVLASCTTQGQSSSEPTQKVGETMPVIEATKANTEVVPSGEPDKVVIWSTGDNGTVKDWATDPILKVVEEKTNTKIEMVKIGWDTFLEQVNSSVAAGKPPDIFGVIDHNNKTQMQQWVDDGVIAAYEGAVAEAAPNVLAEYQKNPTLQELLVNGKIYGQPISWGDGNYPNMGLLHVRHDLLEKYNMQPPNTFEEYFNFLRAAKEDGIQGVLFSAGNGIGPAINAFTGAFGVPMIGWVRKEGKFEYWAIQPQVKEALLLFRKLVIEGLVDPTSWEDKEGKARDMYVAGQSASLIFNGGGHTGRIQNDMDLAGKGAKEYLLPALEAGKGYRGYTSEPMFWGLSFLGGMKNNNPVAAARVINYLISDEGYQLTAVGVEGIDFERDQNGEIVLLPKRTERGFPTEAGDTGAHPLATAVVSWVPQQWQDWALLYGKDQAYKDWYKQMWENQGKFQIQTYGLLSTSPLWTQFQQTSSELITRNFLEIVKADSEEKAIATFDQFVKDWLANGGKDAQDEMSEKLQAIYK